MTGKQHGEVEPKFAFLGEISVLSPTICCILSLLLFKEHVGKLFLKKF